MGGSVNDDSSCDPSIQILDGVSNPLLSEYSWYCGSASKSQVVAQLEPNGFGLYDMSGNVLEWIHDPFGCDVPESTEDPYCNPQSTSYSSSYASMHPMKGGHVGTVPTNTKVTARHSSLPSTRESSYGFRVVRSKP